MSLAVQSVIQQMFCGDEIKATVVDLGSHQCRFGFAGQDTPRYRFRPDVGIIASESSSSSSSNSASARRGSAVAMDVGEGDEASATAAPQDGKHTPPLSLKPGHICGDQNLRHLRADMDIRHPFRPSSGGSSRNKDAVSAASSANPNNPLDRAPVGIDWAAVETLLTYGTVDAMRTDPREYPILFAENDFGSYADKSRLLQFCFEGLGAPAMWVADNAVLSAFSSGRPTALVVDFGASGTRVTPVVDGFALRTARVCTSRGGERLDTLVSAALAAAGVSVKPWFDVASSASGGKGGAGAGAAAVSAQLRQLHRWDEVRDAKHWMSFVPYMPVPSASRDHFITNVIKLPPYELPDGTLISHNDALCTGAEAMFFAAAARPLLAALPGMPASAQPVDADAETSSLPELLRAAVLRSDVDCRKELLANTCLVGGGSLIDGMSPRLTHEMAELLPAHLKCKIQTQLPDERLNAAWIGGSILSICGSFQQMWISRQEWEEHGDALLAHRLH